MDRMMADCRRYPSESNCQMTFIGPVDELVEAAAQHAISVHGHEDSPDLRDNIRGMLEPEAAFTPGEREPEELPAEMA